MFRHPVYLLYGLMTVGFAGYAGSSGWGFDKPDEVKNVPKSIRDNPGAYRSHYSFYPRYMGGK